MLDSTPSPDELRPGPFERAQNSNWDAPEPVPLTESVEARPARPGRPHLVVVMTREVRAEDAAPVGAVLITRFWHPRDHRWSINYFDSLEHAFRLFIDESGWALRQQQSLATPQSFELIFEARRADFAGPSTEEMLGDIGLTPGDVADILNHEESGDDPA